MKSEKAHWTLRELPVHLGLHRIDEQRPGILKVGDHDHREDRGDELDPSVLSSMAYLGEQFRAGVHGAGAGHRQHPVYLPFRPPRRRSASSSSGRPLRGPAAWTFCARRSFAAPAIRCSMVTGRSQSRASCGDFEASCMMAANQCADFRESGHAGPEWRRVSALMRIESHVAEELDPDFMAKVRGDGSLSDPLRPAIPRRRARVRIALHPARRWTCGCLRCGG